jgi:hypothetical protein
MNWVVPPSSTSIYRTAILELGLVAVYTQNNTFTLPLRFEAHPGSLE